LPAFHHLTRKNGKSWPDTGDLQLAVSRDARNFRRLGGRRPFLRLGMEGSFYSKWIWPVLQPLRMGDELWLYYWGTNSNHSSVVDPKAKELDSAISRAILRLDGFVSVDAAYSGGWLTTPPLTFEGSHSMSAIRPPMLSGPAGVSDNNETLGPNEASARSARASE